MTVPTITDDLVAELEASVSSIWPDHDIAVLTLKSLLAERAELKRQLEESRSYQDMAGCMELFMRDMIKFGVLDDGCPPMFATEGVMAHIAELKRQLDHFRSALTKLSQVPGCGCDFPCRCGGAEWTQHELEGRIDCAIKALEAMQEQPS